GGGYRAVGPAIRSRRIGRFRGARRVLPLERGALEARGRYGAAHRGRQRYRALGAVARLRLSRRGLVRGARASRSRRGADGRRARARGRAVSMGSASLVPRNLLIAAVCAALALPATGASDTNAGRHVSVP